MNSEQGAYERIVDRWIAVRLFVTVYLICLLCIDDRLFSDINRFQYLAQSLAQNHTIDIRGIEQIHGGAIHDAFEFQGRRILWQNPGVSFFVTPAYSISRWLHIEETISGLFGAHFVPAYHDFIFSMTINAPFAGIFVTSLWLILRERGLTRRLSSFIVSCAFWGSMTAYYFTIGNNVQTAVELSLTTVAWLFVLKVDRDCHPHRLLFLSGMFLGLANLVSAPAFFTTICTVLYAVLRHNKKAWPIIAGLVPGVGMLLAYQWIAFGNPLVNASMVSTVPVQRTEVSTIVSITSVAREFLVGRDVGIIWYFPLIVVLFLGFFRRKSVTRLSILCWTLIIGHWLLASYFVSYYVTNWGWRGGEWVWQQGVGAGGSRYLMQVVPFVALLITQLDLRSLRVRQWIMWMGAIGLSLNIPVMMYPAGGPVFRSLFLMLRHGMSVPLSRVANHLVQTDVSSVASSAQASDAGIFLTWFVVFGGFTLCIWKSSRFRDWLYED